jgi:taurine dioxygenase
MYSAYESLPDLLKQRVQGHHAKHDGTYNSGGYVRPAAGGVGVLVDDLWSFATRDEFTWRNEWQTEDIGSWDNRCNMHPRDSFDPASRRVLHRTQIKSETSPSA